MKKIPQIEPFLGDEEKQELISVIESGWYTEAERTRTFEKMFSEFVGSRFAIAVTSGTTALFVGLKALGVGAGDEVIVPDLTFVASPNSVVLTGARPILVDIESKSLNLDLEQLEKKITNKTKAIMPVDFNGRSTSMNQLQEIAKKHNLLLIEDACHAIGCFHNGRHMGTLSDVGVFSFSTPKIITTGQGGMIVTDDQEVYNRCLEIKDFGRNSTIKKDMIKAFDHKTFGLNFKFTEFQAAVGIAQMKKLGDRVKIKRNMFKLYRNLLSSVKEIEFFDTNLKNVTPWMVDILLKNNTQRNQVISYLENSGIETRVFYPAIHTLPIYKQDYYELPISSEISSKGLWLPSSISLTEEDIIFISNKIKECIN